RPASADALELRQPPTRVTGCGGCRLSSPQSGGTIGASTAAAGRSSAVTCIWRQNMYTPGSAGHSALKQAGRLLQKQVVDVSKWAGSAWGVGGVGFLLAPGSLSVVSLVAGGAA